MRVCIVISKVVLFSLSLSLATLAQERAPGKPTSGRAWTIEDCVNVFEFSRSETTAAGYQYWFADRWFLDGRTLKLSVVAPGKGTHEPHAHDEDEFFVVLAGTAEFFLNGDRRSVGSMTSLYCPPQSRHGIRNAGPDTLRYLVIKKYERP